MSAPAPRPILVSACLLGLNTRYDGATRTHQAVLDFLQHGDWLPVPVCPEQLGGLPTPRPPAEFKTGDGATLLTDAGRLFAADGGDVTDAFRQGAEQTTTIASLCGCELALLKERSPSCGVHQVHRDGVLVAGIGVTAARLRQAGLPVFSEEDLAAGRLPDLSKGVTA